MIDPAARLDRNGVRSSAFFADVQWDELVGGEGALASETTIPFSQRAPLPIRTLPPARNKTGTNQIEKGQKPSPRKD